MAMDLLIEKLAPIKEDYSEQLSSRDFNENYASQDSPVIFRKNFKNWNIKSKWTTDYLLKNLPEIIEVDNDKISLKSLFKNSEKKHVYSSNLTPNSKLRHDYNDEVPDYFYCWYKNNFLSKQPTKYFSWLYISEEGTKTPLHQDVWFTSAWNYLVRGTKLWLFYPKVFNKIINDNPQAYDFDDLFNKLNKMEPNIIEPQICLQQPGDLVFTPGDMYHSVLNLDFSVSVTENFINNSNCFKVLGFFKAKKFSSKNIEAMEAIISSGLSNLKV